MVKVVYRVGDLDKYKRKADSMYQMFGRSTGYFGTGYYFCTKPENCCTMTRENDPLYKLTLKDGIKLFRGDRTAHEFLKKFNNYMINYPLLCNNKDLIDKEKDFARKAESFYTEHFLIGSSIKTMFEAWGDDYDGWEDYFQKDWNIKDLTKKAKAVPGLEEFANILESENPNFERLDEIQKENPNLFDYEYISSMKSLMYDVLELLPIHLNTNTATIKMAADHIYETYESFYENGRLRQDPKLAEDDSFPTMLLRILGYDGVWPSMDCDNTAYGGVIFDLENFTYERIADHAKDYTRKTESKKKINEASENCYTAYHIGPNLFADFDLEHIGDGFNTQLKGWGLYFTLDKDVIEYYRAQLEDCEGPDYEWYLYEVEIEKDHIENEYDKDGWELYAQLVNELGSEKKASKSMVEDNGIDGIKYYDEEDGNSLLIFNPKIIHIKKTKPITAYGKVFEEKRK